MSNSPNQHKPLSRFDKSHTRIH